MNVKVIFDRSKINEVLEDSQKALSKTADLIKGDLIESKTMPFGEGELQNRNTFVDDSEVQKGIARVVSDTPYARRLYYHPEYNFRKDKNPNAGGMWFEPYISGDKRDYAQKAFKKFMGGKYN